MRVRRTTPTKPGGIIHDSHSSLPRPNVNAPFHFGHGGHRPDVDVMRLAACVTVMLGHAGGSLIRRTRDDFPDASANLVGHLAEAVNPWAVPLFFAIAGWATLAGAPPRTEHSAFRRIVRHAIPLAVWSALYLLIFNAFDSDAVDVRSLAVQSFFQSDRPAYHLWYLYNYIPLITIFGALILFLRGRRPWLLVALSLVFASGSVLSEHAQALAGVELGDWKWGIATYQVAFFIMGGFLIHYARTFTVPRWVLASVFGSAAVGVLLWETGIHYPIQNANPLTFVLGACVVLLSGSLSVSEQASARLKVLASASFGAFLVHIVFVEVVFMQFFPLDLGFALTLALFVLGWVAVAVVSFALSLGWGRLRMRRYLG